MSSWRVEKYNFDCITISPDSGGVESKNVSGSGDCACCLSDDLILQLGKIGIDVSNNEKLSVLWIPFLLICTFVFF